MTETRQNEPGTQAKQQGSDENLVAVWNPGSSSLKYELVGASGSAVASGIVDRIGVTGECPNHQVATECAFKGLDAQVPRWTDRTIAVGYRVVHGGPDLWEPTRFDESVLAELERQIPLAPLHIPAALAVARAALLLLPRVPHVAVFDTGFHHDLPTVARTYAVSAGLAERLRIRRYGFHGISVEFLVQRLAELAPERRQIVVCHLGAGASVTAVRDGRSIDTSMGFTPLEGLPMATRCGDLDPSIPLYLQDQAGMTAAQVSQLLEHESGLKGLSGTSGDFREISERASAGDPASRLALDVFAYRIRKYVGAYWAALEGLDAVVFAGGIGEHSAPLREAVLAPLAALGIQLDPKANADGPAERQISTPDSPVSVWVIPTDESAVIARHARAFAR